MASLGIRGGTAPEYELMAGVLAQNWWAIGIRGVLAVLFGLIALFWPGVTMLSLVLVFAAYAFVDGVFGIISAVRAARHHERWGFLILEGLVNIAAAAVAVLWPGMTVLVFVFVVAFWAMFTGILELAAAFQLDSDHGRWWLALGGLASVAYGALLIFAPILGAVVLTWWVGAYAVVFGLSLIVLAFRLRARLDDHSPGSAARAAV